MANKINTDELNESLIIASVRKDRTITPENNPVEVVPNPEPAPALNGDRTEQPAQPAQPEPERIPVVSEPPKDETRNKRAGNSEYESLFIRETDLPPARFGKSVYIRKDYHDRISQIISVIGGNEISLFGYIDNVLAHHFEHFQDDIVRSFRKKIIFK